ncbi:MAG TPA: type I polyketide synthase [Streptosporangiaceae bacterium]|nr:type I polyketide synthase [Streptosporangiaceae bacterium]
MTRIAVVGMACRYPDAASPAQLWENAIAGRRAFRQIPAQRMSLADYYDPDPTAPDRFYARTAAVIEGYEFDRVGYRIAGSTYRSTDLTHWLALDVAAQALADAGFPGGDGLPHERTGVVVGNTLTGEFTRANLMRLRWPYVRRTLADALAGLGWEPGAVAEFLAGVEQRYKQPFPPVDEDTLAGGLSNTIAGRICNYFDLQGGGYCVDGACSSSLLSVTNACAALCEGGLDVALAGGVDLSIDPFEIIGFAKTGALAKTEMRVYDRGSNGFWPGEGCGMVVLMREADALRRGARVYASVCGWGISSDGSGGMTRPEVSGYRMALRRAYERAGFGIDTVSLFEGHGTGTAVGDATELTALSQARREAGAPALPAAVGSVKGMIGHTKAAAGVAGLIKAVLALHHQVLPPAIGCVDPHPVLREEPAVLRSLRKAEPWPQEAALRAGVTAMGFGGINAHVVLAGTTPYPAGHRAPVRLASSVQDAELLLVDGASQAELRERLAELAAWVPVVSYAELADLAATARQRLRDLPYRAAVVASSPTDAAQQLTQLLESLDDGETTLASGDGRAFVGHVRRPPKIGYLFPGQGSGRGTSGGALSRRFAEAESVYAHAGLPTAGDMTATAVAQPRIVTGSMAGLRVLERLGLTADVAVGHSLGEITALQWAGALDEQGLLRVAAMRGQTMTEHAATGTMASLSAGPEAVAPLLAGLPLVVAGQNGPRQVVIAGSAEAVEAAGHRASAANIGWSRLAVSHAFHSPLVAAAAGAFAGWLATQQFGPLTHRVVSTVTGEPLAADTDIPALLHRQITSPVLFWQALLAAAKDVDLLVEVGPGRVLTGLARDIVDVPAVALDTDDESITGLLRTAGAAYVAGAPLCHEALFDGRLIRPLEVGAELRFFACPCEQAPPLASGVTQAAGHLAESSRPQGEASPVAAPGQSSVALLSALAAERAELPVELVHEDSRLLDDLHLSSITVGQLLNQAVRQLGLSMAQAPTNFATATVRELAETLDLLAQPGQVAVPPPAAEGAAPWARAFAVRLDEVPRPARGPAEPDGAWVAYGSSPLAEALRQALERAGVGPGVLACLPPECTEADLVPVLAAAQAAAQAGPGSRFVLVQHGRGAAGLAKTLRQEAPHLRVTIAVVPPLPEALPWVVSDVAATMGCSEVHYTPDGARLVPVLHALPVRATREHMPLGPQDVLLVTGGGKGITAECALTLAKETGARLALLGRSDPAADAELSANLARMAGQSVTAHYVRADVTDPGQVAAAVAEVAATLGPVSAVLHGAGRNEPAALARLDAADLRSTLAPKVDGLRAVLAAVDPANLRLLVTFGSIIGRAGLHGQACYAIANEWLADLTHEVSSQWPQCRCRCLEWSVWSGVGMGERLSVVEDLARAGITPINPGQGVELMRRLVADPDAPTVAVVSGRTAGNDTVRYDAPPLPLLRFVGRPLVRYHGAELVTETELNVGTDPYLRDHLLDTNLLFPAVFGLEAMAQVACAATGRAEVPVIEDAEFLRPIVVPPEESLQVRVAATVTADDTVAVAVRSAETSFATEHFRARLRFTGDVAPEGPPEQAEGLPLVALDPAADLYGGVLFQGAKFHRLRRYHRAAARSVDADLAVGDGDGWFADFLPPDLLLGDPGMRDALMHGTQVCVPHATLLPVGVARLYPAGPGLAAGRDVRYCATERCRDGDTYTYDIAVRDQDGRLVERWEGLVLRAVRKLDGAGPWVPGLLGPYLERAQEELTGAPVAVAVVLDTRAGNGSPGPDGRATAGGGGVRRARTAAALAHALGRVTAVRYRPDGRPETDADRAVSASHGAGLVMGVAASGTVACDVAAVPGEGTTQWDGLLGQHATLAGLLASEQGEDARAAATRVWAVHECLAKAGLPQDAPLTLGTPQAGGWVVFACGQATVATFLTTLRDRPDPVVFAILSQRRS